MFNQQIYYIMRKIKYNFMNFTSISLVVNYNFLYLLVEFNLKSINILNQNDNKF